MRRVVKTSQAGVNLIKSFEGVQLDAYFDAVGVLTIGYGHTGPDVKINSRIDTQQAEIILKKDLAKFEEAVSRLVEISLNQAQFDALVSFTFNVGIGALEQSTLLKRLNAKENPFEVVKEELPRWNKGDGGRVLAGLSRRRSSEVELFCQSPPVTKTGLISITSKQQTYLKKRPLPALGLAGNEKADVYQGRTIRNCKILERKNKHTCLELGFGLGQWWVFDDHWIGLETEIGIKPYAMDGDLHYLRNFPYYYQQDNGPEGWRQCQTSSLAMCLHYIDIPGINDDKDYLKIISKYGDTTRREPHFAALAELGAYAKFTISADEHDVKKEIDSGLPVVAGILHHGDYLAPTGNGHFIVLTGYGKDYWLAQDPYGKLDVVNGGWLDRGATAGKNVKYPFRYLNPRFFVGGGANGWCWINFRKK